MIALILGTSEGKEIISLLNNFTDNILVSTATEYGAKLLKNYKYKKLNNKGLSIQELENMLKENNIKVLVDASHPYALEVSKNCIKVCEILNIDYIRYERPSVIDEFLYYDKLKIVNSYEDLIIPLKDLKGNILNTSGSRNMSKILSLELNNRIIHRVLPSLKVLEECFNLGVKVEDIILIKGPTTKELNSAFIKEYNAKAIILKDSGVQGGTREKILAAIENNIYVLVINRKNIKYKNQFSNVVKLVKYIRKFYF